MKDHSPREHKAPSDDKISGKGIEQEVFPKETEVHPIDFNTALVGFNNDKEFLIDCVLDFIKSAKVRSGSISSAIKTGDCKVIENEGHALKGSAGMIYALKLSYIAFEIEKAGIDADIVRSTKHFGNFQVELERLIAFIENWG